MSSIKEVYNNIFYDLQKVFEKDGFKKKDSKTLIRCQENCNQYITILFNKVKGSESGYLQYNIQYSFESINKIVAYLKGRQYDKKWVTGSVNLSTLVQNGKVFRHFIDLSTDTKYIVNEVYQLTKNYAYKFLDNYNTVEKFIKGLEENNNIVSLSTAALNKREWNMIASYLLLKENDNIKKVIEEWENFKPDNNLLANCLEKAEKIDLTLFTT